MGRVKELKHLIHISNPIIHDCMSQEKLKTMLTQNFWGQTKCIMGDVKVVNWDGVCIQRISDISVIRLMYNVTKKRGPILTSDNVYIEYMILNRT